jgi:hypothetical protein
MARVDQLGRRAAMPLAVATATVGTMQAEWWLGRRGKPIDNPPAMCQLPDMPRHPATDVMRQRTLHTAQLNLC